jgi:RNA polymerase sigma factor (sigma-70 family)
MGFEALVKKISPKLKGITYRLNGHFTFMSHDDLYQEALLHLWVDFQQGRLTDKTDSYILQGCFFHLKNYIRTVQDKVHVTSMDILSEESGTDLADTLPAEDPALFLETLDNRILAEIIRGNGLTPREEQLISLFCEGLTIRQIGERLGISHVAVVKFRDRIRKKCYRSLGSNPWA